MVTAISKKSPIVVAEEQIAAAAALVLTFAMVMPLMTLWVVYGMAEKMAQVAKLVVVMVECSNLRMKEPTMIG